MDNFSNSLSNSPMANASPLNPLDSNVRNIQPGQMDYRFPLYIGDWKRSIPYQDAEPTIDDLDEPHIKRKVEILARHPDIKNL